MFTQDTVEVVDQVAAGNASDGAAGTAFADFVGDGLEQMGFADTVGSVNEKRVVQNAGFR